VIKRRQRRWRRPKLTVADKARKAAEQFPEFYRRPARTAGPSINDGAMRQRIAAAFGRPAADPTPEPQPDNSEAQWNRDHLWSE
jgi:hypothetical protein